MAVVVVIPMVFQLGVAPAWRFFDRTRYIEIFVLAVVCRATVSWKASGCNSDQQQHWN
jgi:hypothetical protein